MNPKIIDIQKAVCSLYGITHHEMLSDRRNRHAAWPRQVAMFLALELTPHTKTEVGREFNRDHSTVISAVRSVKKRMDGELDLNLDVLRKHLGQPPSGIPKATAEHLGTPRVIPKATPQHFGVKPKRYRKYHASPHNSRNREGIARSCITCGDEFRSEGAHHRMCNSCRNTASDYNAAAGDSGRRVGGQRFVERGY